MMNPITPFNSWILGKLTAYLASKEGCLVEAAEYTKDGMKTVVRDAFGYRYELNIKTLSRVDNNPKDFNENVSFTKDQTIDFLTIRRNEK